MTPQVEVWRTGDCAGGGADALPGASGPQPVAER